ncbi:MAG: sodium:calcium antiporter [Ardenticatenia bacterium]|nr:MAG: sodium:calcium antiporter [Ardenticatenia bacterium]
MALHLILILIGLVGLFFGADWLVKGAARLAQSFGVSPLVIGLTVVAFGTSAPELLVSLTAAMRGSSDISIGNVVGSNIANIGLILGLTGLIFPIVVHSRIVRRELPLMIGVSLALVIFMWDGSISRLDGLLMVLGLIAFNVGAYWEAERGNGLAEELAEFEEVEELIETSGEINRLQEVGRLGVGLVVLMIGAQLTVDNAVAIARAIGVSELVIGVTLVAFGTSLPELATSLVAAFRRESDISVGNIIGSNIYNILAILGITSLVRPISISQNVLTVQTPVMLAFAIGLWPLVYHEHIDRKRAALMFAGYVAYIVALFVFKPA